MKLIRSAKRLREALERARAHGKRIGFVPTMGCLHEGHLSLVRSARRENDIVVVSIFVNPTQFGPREDFKRYPRSLTHDRRLLSREQTAYLFVPSRATIYPNGFSDFVDPGPMARYLCGPKRPGHFRGVATVVKRLFEIVEPHAAYFGLKDYQQARIVQDMADRLGGFVKVRTCPLVRESDGLAMSSRNRYLSKQERTRARSLYRSLREAKKRIGLGERNSSEVKSAVRKILLHEVDTIDYIEAVDPSTCAPKKQVQPPVLVAIACYIGSTRLIDNILIRR